jgi:hypothetical protein
MEQYFANGLMTSRLKVVAEEQQNIRLCAVRDAFSRRDEGIT